MFLHLFEDLFPASLQRGSHHQVRAGFISKTIAPLAASGTALISRPALPEPPSYLSPCPASSSAPQVTCPTDVPASHLRLCPAGAPTPLARLRSSPPASPVPLLISPLARPTPRPPVPRPQQRPGEAEAAVPRSLRSCLGIVSLPQPPRALGRAQERCREPLALSQRPAPEEPRTPGSQARQPASRLLLGSGALGRVCLSSSPGQPRSLPAASTAVCFLRCVSFFPLLGSIKGGSVIEI